MRINSPVGEATTNIFSWFQNVSKFSVLLFRETCHLVSGPSENARSYIFLSLHCTNLNAEDHYFQNCISALVDLNGNKKFHSTWKKGSCMNLYRSGHKFLCVNGMRPWKTSPTLQQSVRWIIVWVKLLKTIKNLSDGVFFCVSNCGPAQLPL